MANLRSGFFAGGLIYALGQLANFAFQLSLLQAFGLDGYGQVGLAHLLVTTILFVGDLGYSALFLREDTTAPLWEARWRVALLYRLCLTILLDVLAVLGWWMIYGVGGEGFGYLLGAIPATLFGLIGFSAILLAQGRQCSGFLVQQVAWLTALLVWLFVRRYPGWSSGVFAGLAVSLGFAAQALVNFSVLRRPALLWPARSPLGREMLRSALHMSAMGIAGIINDRLTPFLLVYVAPAFLPIYLLLNHAMSGASGVINQFNRLLLIQAKTTQGRRSAYLLASWLLLGVTLGLQTLPMIVKQWGDSRAQAWLDLAFPVLLGWGISTVASVPSVLLIGQGKERALAKVVVWGLVCNTALQLSATALGSAEALLWGRMFCLVAMLLASLRLCGLVLTRPGYWLSGSAALAALAMATPWFWWASVGLLLCTAVAASQQRLIFCEIALGNRPS